MQISCFQKYKIRFIANLIIIFIIGFARTAAQDFSKNGNRSTIIVGSEPGYPPYCFVNDQGKADGFSVELLKAAANEMDLNVEFEIDVWKKLKQDLAEHKIDALPLVGRTPEREDIFDFTFPYLTRHGTIVVRKNQNGINSISDLTGKQIAVLEGDNAQEYLNRIDIDANIVPRHTFEEAMIELSDGKHDAVVIQKYLAFQIIKDNNLNNLKTVGDPRETFKQSFCFAVSENDDELLSLLNEGLSIVISKGIYQMLNNKWFAPLETRDQLPDRLVIGGDYNFPPYEFLDENGQPTGFVVDLTRAIAKQMDIKVEITLGPWSEVIKKLQKGEIDAIQGMLYSAERDLNFDLSPAHTVIGYVIAGRTDKPLPNYLSELTDKSILVQNGDIMHDRALQLGLKDQLIVVETQEKALQLLSKGKGDVALVSKMLAYYYIDRHDYDNIVINEKPVHSPEYCYTVQNGNTALLAELSEGLAALKSSGQYREIYSKWLGPYEERNLSFMDILQYSLVIIVPFTLAFIGVLLWTYTLKRKVKERTHELEEEVKYRRLAEQKVKKSEEKYREIVESTHDTMLISQKNKIIFHNKAFQKMTGYNKQELEEKSLNQIIIEKEALHLILEEKKKPVASPKNKYEMKIEKKDGSVIDVEIQATPIKFHNQSAHLLVLRDITEKKALLEKLQKTKEEVDKLGNFIPICSSCKKIKDLDKKDQPWVEPEVYIMKRLSGIQFSHGICPECMKELYPKYYKEKYPKDSFSKNK